MQELRHNTIKWLCQSLGELQSRIKVLESENAALRDKIKQLGKEQRTANAIAKVAGRV